MRRYIGITIFLLVILIPSVMAGSLTRSFSVDSASPGEVITVTLTLDRDANENTMAFVETIPADATFVNLDNALSANYNPNNPQDIAGFIQFNDFSPDEYTYDVRIGNQGVFNGMFAIAIVPQGDDPTQVTADSVTLGDNTLILQGDREPVEIDCGINEELIDGRCVLQPIRDNLDCVAGQIHLAGQCIDRINYEASCSDGLDNEGGAANGAIDCFDPRCQTQGVDYCTIGGVDFMETGLQTGQFKGLITQCVGELPLRMAFRYGENPARPNGRLLLSYELQNDLQAPANIGQYDACLSIEGGSLVTINCNDHAITGNGLGKGIIGTGPGFTLQNCEISGFEDGVWLQDSSKPVLSNNNIHDNTNYGLLMSSVSLLNMQSNQFCSNSEDLRCGRDVNSVYGENNNADATASCDQLRVNLAGWEWSSCPAAAPRVTLNFDSREKREFFERILSYMYPLRDAQAPLAFGQAVTKAFRLHSNVVGNEQTQGQYSLEITEQQEQHQEEFGQIDNALDRQTPLTRITAIANVLGGEE